MSTNIWNIWWVTAVILLIAAILGIVIGILIVYLRDGEARAATAYETQGTIPLYAPRWVLELWDIGCGNCYRAGFDGGLTLGRGIPGRDVRGFLSVGQDVTLSREHCLIFEQNNMTFLCNLSKINTTLLNGSELNQPQAVQAGDRIAMGGHTFLITMLQRGI